MSPARRTQGLAFQRSLPLEVVASCLAISILWNDGILRAQTPSETPPNGGSSQPSKLYVREYRVRGTKVLPAVEVEKAVYPFLGPERTPDDIEAARAALEKAYHDQGFQTVFVAVPPQTGRRGVIFLEVTEAKVGRLRVKGARYYLPSDILKRAPSMQEGRVPNFNEVTKDIVGLNQSADLRVTPSVQPGVEPGTVDIDLTVKDTFPLHGSIELNNRYSADTVPLRLNGSLSYNNLWQLGHSLGFSFQVAPERLDDAKVFSGYYTAKIPGFNDVSLTLQGTKQDSNVSTLGGAAVAGRGHRLTPSPVSRAAQERGIPVLTPVKPSDPEFIATLTELAPDCCPVTSRRATASCTT